jgi:hypothetical protein
MVFGRLCKNEQRAQVKSLQARKLKWTEEDRSGVTDLGLWDRKTLIAVHVQFTANVAHPKRKLNNPTETATSSQCSEIEIIGGPADLNTCTDSEI